MGSVIRFCSNDCNSGLILPEFVTVVRGNDHPPWRSL